MSKPIYIGKLKGELEPILDTSDQEILGIIKNNTSGSIFAPTSTIEKTEHDNKNKLHQSWASRKHNYNAPSVDILHTFDVSQPVLVCHLHDNYQDSLNNFKNVFIVNNIENYLLNTDYNVFVDINHQDYINKAPCNRTYVYMSQFTGRWKQAQKLWNVGDLRSFNHIDPEVYKNYSKVSLIGAATLYMLSLFSGDNIVVIGNEIEENCAITQTIWSRFADRLIHI